MFKKIEGFIKRMWAFLKNPLNLVIYIIVVILFFSPAIVGYLFAWVSGNAWHLTYATAYIAFWAGPFTPAIPVQLAITFAIRKIIDKFNNRSNKFMENLKKVEMRIQRNNNLNDIYFESDKGPGGGYHDYMILDGRSTGCIPESGTGYEIDERCIVGKISFQKGARKDDDSRHGVLEADLLEIVRHRLQAFQEGDYRTRENACALTHIEEALMWLAKRADDRAERGVLGTMEK